MQENQNFIGLFVGSACSFPIWPIGQICYLYLGFDDGVGQLNWNKILLNLENFTQ